MRPCLIRYLARCHSIRRRNADAAAMAGAASIAAATDAGPISAAVGAVAAVATMVTALAACAPARATEDDALVRLRALSAASACRQAADCATVPVGLKACGGPASYIAVAQADLPAAQALAQRHLQQRQRQLRTQPEPPSTCNLVRDPGARCVENRCTTGNSGNGATPRAD